MKRKVHYAAHWDPKQGRATVYDVEGTPRACGIRSLAEASAVARALQEYDAQQVPPHGLEALDVTGAPV